MMQLLVCADDLTGAMDTGVQFAKKGIRTEVLVGSQPDFSRLDEDVQVLVVDTETRHVPPAEAEETVFHLVRRGLASGLRYFYKKTDSALRGNIGAELSGMLRAGGKPIFFLPAFPKNGRTTAAGMQKVNGVPVAESVFGKDPFEPVRHSYVRDIIREQSGAQVRDVLPGRRPEAADGDGILVLSAETDGDLERWSREIPGAPPLFLAGCAGFAEFLPNLVPFTEQRPERPRCPGKLVVLSGSVNDITLEQLENSRGSADYWAELSDRQKFDPDYTRSADWESCLRKIGEPGCRLSVLGVGRIDPEHEGPFERQTPQARRRDVVSGNLGGMAYSVLRHVEDATLAVFGGDTLYKLLRLAGARLRPCWEIEPGIVAAQLHIGGELRSLVTKSGGFGSPDVICRIQTAVNQYKEEQ
nr:four-carbon acid sugar kinase family protein [uncultured Oscillibacter sp.]